MISDLLLAVMEETTAIADLRDVFDRVVGAIAEATGWSQGRVIWGENAEADGSLLFPVTVDGEVAAVLVFDEEHDSSDKMRRVMRAVCAQLGDIIVRQRHLRDLDRLNDELSRSNADLEQFASVASHDLQEPLRKVIGYCELLQERYSGQLDEDADVFIGYAVDGALRMRSLIQDLLAYARFGRGVTTTGEFDLGDLVGEVVAELEADLTDTGGRVEWEDLPVVRGDRRQIATLLGNLIANGLKFRGDAAALVVVDADVTNDGWSLRVRDEGIGIAEKDHERIFELFRRLHRREVIPGTGIGLAICARVVANHGGRIWVESTPGQGSTFHVEIDTERAR